MKVGRLLSLLSAWLVVAVVVADTARFNKCCAKGEHFRYDEEIGDYVCRDRQDDARDSVEGSNFQDSSEVSQDSSEGTRSPVNASFRSADETFLAFLDAVRNVTLNRLEVAVDDVAENSSAPCPYFSTDFLFATRDDFVVVTPTPARGDYALRIVAGSQVLPDPSVHPSVVFRQDFPAHSFCLELDHEDDLLAALCPCAQVPCVRKCCQDGMAFNEQKQDCEPTSDHEGPWRPEVSAPSKEYYVINNKFLQCDADKIAAISNYDAGALELQDDGASLKGVETDGLHNAFPADSFCADAYLNADGPAQLVMSCIELDVVSETVTVIKGAVTLLGAFALLVTVALTIAFPEMRVNIHGKMALCHNVALLVACVFIGAMQIGGNQMTQPACKAISFVIQYSLLANFFWLNVMCLEVSWVFSAVRPIKKVGPAYVDTKFIRYSVYAWGTPLFISVVTLVVELVPGAKFKPAFGDTNCFFSSTSKIPQLLFMFGPMALLLFANLCLFVFTVSKLVIHRRQTSILSTTNSTTNNRNKQNLVLYGKLFTLMGVTWIFEIVSWAVGGDNSYWLVTDLINLLRGVFIFVMFCCKRSVLESVRTRCFCLAAQPTASTSSAGTKSTTASNEGIELNEPARYVKAPPS